MTASVQQVAIALAAPGSPMPTVVRLYIQIPRGPGRRNN